MRPLRRCSNNIFSADGNVPVATVVGGAFWGWRLLRHSLATQMVVGGGTFKEIADVLGHQSLATTEIYAKLDLGSLSQVAMPWPGGNSNQ
jgi:integrase-like protein